MKQTNKQNKQTNTQTNKQTNKISKVSLELATQYQNVVNRGFLRSKFITLNRFKHLKYWARQCFSLSHHNHIV